MSFTGRQDIAPIPRVIPVLEAMVKIVLADHYLRSKTILKEEPIESSIFAKTPIW